MEILVIVIVDLLTLGIVLVDGVGCFVLGCHLIVVVVVIVIVVVGIIGRYQLLVRRLLGRRIIRHRRPIRGSIRGIWRRVGSGVGRGPIRWMLGRRARRRRHGSVCGPLGRTPGRRGSRRHRNRNWHGLPIVIDPFANRIATATTSTTPTSSSRKDAARRTGATRQCRSAILRTAANVGEAIVGGVGALEAGSAGAGLADPFGVGG